MATLAYRWYKNRKSKQLVETTELDTSESSYPTEPSNPCQLARPTKVGKATKSGKKHDCIHRRQESQTSESAMELTAYPGDPPDIHEKTDMVDMSSPCAECQEAKRAARRYRWRIITGLFVPFLVQSLDVTIIAGALPFIASDFSKPIPSFTHLHVKILNNPQTNLRSSTGSSRPSISPPPVSFPPGANWLTSLAVTMPCNPP